MEYPTQVERWGVFELALPGRSDGNPFTDHTIRARFCCRAETVEVNGFYDGEGVWRVRFMPRFALPYTFRVWGSFADGETSGSFDVTPAAPGNHGPVCARGTHFEYADGTPFHPVGTTAYVWELQPGPLRRRTLDTLAEGWFNKIRFCVFPKHYLYNLHDPVSFPYEGTPCPSMEDYQGEFYRMMHVQPGNHWDFTRFDPAHFRLVEQAVADLGALGIQADLILLHPYDRWGFSEMSAEQDDLYLRYLIARLGAYRNVWWSLANEYDLLAAKTVADWERMGDLLAAEDPYGHLRSIHNCGAPYDFGRPWITHCSLQRTDLYRSTEDTGDWLRRYRKPVVFDEIAYEGDLDQGWGSISGEELVRRFWEAALRGGYASHGETFDRPDGVIWWSHGGALHGESPARLRFLRGILDQTPGAGLRETKGSWDEVAAVADAPDGEGYRLYYYSFMRPCRRRFLLPQGERYEAEIIDTWQMTVTPAGIVQGETVLELPGRPYIAVRLRRC